MSEHWDAEHGCNAGGTTGTARHLGDPLTCQQIRELPDGAEIVITWSGGNGPWPERILVDTEGSRRTEGLYCDRLLNYDMPGKLQAAPLNRVTLGWDDEARAWHAEAHREPEHIRAKWAQLRGQRPSPATPGN